MLLHALLVLPSLLLAVATAGCGDAFGPNDERRALSDNRRRFEREVGGSYSYDYRNVRFAIGPMVEPVRINVRSSAIVSVVLLVVFAVSVPISLRLSEATPGTTPDSVALEVDEPRDPSAVAP